MSRVVVVKVNRASPAARPNADGYRSLLIAGLRRLADTTDTARALRAFLPPGTIGMKTNCLTRRVNSTPVALTEALAQLLVEAGFAADRLVIWDRTSRELAAAGFALNAAVPGLRCFGTDATGVGYSRRFFSSGNVDSLVSRILTDQVAANINLPVLKDHSIAGLSAGMKNMYGAIHNPNKYHENHCDPACAHVNALEPIRGKNRLVIIDAVRVQYDRGPGFVPEYVADFGALLFSTDPVAADRIGLEIVEHLRLTAGLRSLEAEGRPATYLDSAARLGLGTAERSDVVLDVVALDDDGVPHPAELFG